MPLNTVALELVPPTVQGGRDRAVDEAGKVLTHAEAAGVTGRIRHVLIPGMIVEDDDRPVAMQPRVDVLEFWGVVGPELPDVRGLCTQVTAFTDEPALRGRLGQLVGAGFDGVVFVGVPRTMQDGEGSGVAPVDALSVFADLVPQRGVVLIPTRAEEQGRFAFKSARGATFALTQLLYSDAIVGMLTDFARTHEQRPEILLSFGWVPKVEAGVGLISWLIQDAGNPAVEAEQAFVRRLAETDEPERRRLLVDLYRRVVDGVGSLGFPISIHLEAPYGLSAPAFALFAEMLESWSPRPA